MLFDSADQGDIISRRSSLYFKLSRARMIMAAS
jgi:hypothetical protein